MGQACRTLLVVLLILFNIFSMMIGAAILCFAIYCYVDATVQSAISHSGHTDRVQNLLYGLIGFGTLTVIVTVFGCCGAYQESPCILGTYFTCLLIMFGVEIAVGVLCLIFREETVDRIADALDNVVTSFKDESTNDGSGATYRDVIQRVLHCCGIYGVEDYSGLHVPPSCCIPDHPGCPDKSAAYKAGCKQVASDLVHEKFVIAIALILSIPTSKLFGFIFTLLLCSIVSRRNSVEYTEVRLAP